MHLKKIINKKKKQGKQLTPHRPNSSATGTKSWKIGNPINRTGFLRIGLNKAIKKKTLWRGFGNWTIQPQINQRQVRAQLRGRRLRRR